MQHQRINAKRWTLILVSCVIAGLMVWIACFAWSMSRLSQAAAKVEQAGAEVWWLPFGPEYIHFDKTTNDSTLRRIKPALDELWTVTEIHLEGSAVTDTGLMRLVDMHSLYCIVVTGTAVSDEGIQELKRRLNRGDELQVIR